MFFILLLSALILVACGIPLWVRRQQGEGRSLIILACTYYALSFGLRAMYLMAFPDVVLFPSIDPRADTAPLSLGLSWTLLGVLAMVVTYFKTPLSRLREGHIHRVWGPALRSVSHWPILGILYAVGWCARIYMLRTGAAFWLYASPVFDGMAGRPAALVIGAVSLLADLAPLACGGFFAAILLRPTSNARRMVVFGVWISEVFYFSLTAYKFGLLGAMLIPCVIFSLREPKKLMSRLLVVCVITGGVLIPVIDAARGSMSKLYSSFAGSGGDNTGEFVAQWGDQFGQLQPDAYLDIGDRGIRSVLDGTLQRLTGVESVGAAEKYAGPAYRGASYVNILKLLVPRALRPWSSTMFIIPWETEFVGFSDSNLTVVPTPMIVEAFLNFRVIGVIIVMSLAGFAYRRIDSLALIAQRYNLTAACYAYLCWRLLNLEHPLYDYALPPIKLVCGLLVLVSVARLSDRKQFTRRSVRVATSRLCPTARLDSLNGSSR